MCVWTNPEEKKREYQESFYWFAFWGELADLGKRFVLPKKAETRSEIPLFLSDMQTAAAAV